MLTVSTSIGRLPTAGSFSMAVLTRVVIVVSSSVSLIVFAHAAERVAASIAAAIVTFQLLRSGIVFPTYGLQLPCPAERGLSSPDLHPGHMETCIDHQHLAGDATSGVTEKKC